MKASILFFFLFFSINILGKENVQLGESPNGMLMGGAYTSLAEDEFSLFYNPALLARNKGFSFTPINPRITGVNVLKEPDRFKDLGDDPSNIADAALGFPIHIGINLAPGFKMGNFGMTAIMNNQTNINLQNKVAPVLDIDYRYDKGFIMGYGQPVSGSYVTGGSGNQVAVGASVKYINRESIYGTHYLFGTSLLDALSAGEIGDVLNQLGKVNGSGWGFDAGVDYVNSTGASTFAAGLAIMDIYTLLHTESNVNNLEVQPQPMQVNFGSSLKHSLGGGFDFTFSADIKHLEQQMEFMRRVHLGAEIGLSPAISLIAGLNALDNYSYGLKLNTGLLKAYAGFYGVEVGEKLGQQDSNRLLVYFSILHFSFDP